MSLSIYLHFNGNCREVFEYYRSVFGGDFASISTFGEGPPGMGITDDEIDQVMHVALPIGDSILMGSDMPEAFGPPPAKGSNFAITYSLSDRSEADDLFAKLSDGGQVTMPMDNMFWGSYFGSCIDKFGISWQLDVPVSDS